MVPFGLPVGVLLFPLRFPVGVLLFPLGCPFGFLLVPGATVMSVKEANKAKRNMRLSLMIKDNQT